MVMSVLVWSTVASSNSYVALGHVATPDASPPDCTQVRMVHTSLTTLVDSDFKAIRVWKNSGTGGKPLSLWSNPMTGLMLGCLGHDTAPESSQQFALLENIDMGQLAATLIRDE